VRLERHRAILFSALQDVWTKFNAKAQLKCGGYCGHGKQRDVLKGKRQF
jgi:hypothetical protein